MKTIGILTSGGDCPGLNAVIRGVVRAADTLGWKVLGFRNGFEGLLRPGDYVELDRSSTAGIMHLGGTILGTTNRGHFVSKVRGGDKAEIDPDILDEASRTLKSLHVDALIVVGGDGSLTTAHQFYRAGFPVIGVPKTIDNDLEATAMTFGFDSAVACVADALDRLHTTATSHRRVMVLEVMGRHAGWIALYGGLAGGGDVILIPEIPFDYDNIARAIQKREEEGCLSHMIVVAEGAVPKDGRPVLQETPSGEFRLGGVGDLITREISKRTRKETRTCVLGHLQRGGAPTTLDRILGTRFGVAAVDFISKEKFGSMVSYQNYQVLDVPIATAVHRIRKVPVDSQMIATARAIGISFGD